MPPITQQGSRTGLITAVVVFTILFVVATIFAIYYAVQAQTHQEEYLTLRNTTIPKLLPEGASTDSPLARELEAAKGREEPGITPNMPLMTVAVTQRNNLAAAIDPSAPPAAALDAAKAALSRASQKVNKAGVTLPSNQQNMAGAVDALGTAVVNKQQQIEQLQQQLTAAQKSLQSKTAELTSATQKLDEVAKQLRAESEKAQAGVTEYRSGVAKQVGEIEQAREQERGALQEQVNKLNVELASRNAQVTRLQNDVRTLQNRLGERRVDAAEATIRHADGQIVRLGSNDILYINLGSNQRVIPGLTFSVYDRRTGVPPLSAGANQENADEQVRGKAEIEVIRVDQNSSECRVTSRSPGASPIQEGDLIANLVYDPNTRYNFFVYGRFDLDRNNVATAQDTDVVRRLIEQWGGQLANDINVNTDFVVIGAEPVVPNLTREEEADPILVQRRAQAQQDLNQYLEIINKARDLHIPILNQNRFLYFIGYFDQARR